MFSVPCTVTEADMQQNNIELKHKYGEEKNKKIYSEHADSMSFECKRGYQISDKSLLRIQCLEGVLKYPRCLKEGKPLNLQSVFLTRTRFPPTILLLNLCDLFNKQVKKNT